MPVTKVLSISNSVTLILKIKHSPDKKKLFALFFLPHEVFQSCAKNLPFLSYLPLSFPFFFPSYPFLFFPLSFFFPFFTLLSFLLSFFFPSSTLLSFLL